MRRLLTIPSVCVALIVATAGCGNILPPGKPAPAKPTVQTKVQQKSQQSQQPPVVQQSPPAPVDPATPIVSADPCANRLHDVCGALLFYYVVNRRLPERLDELHELPGFEHVRDFTCPVSHKPYVFNPSGIYDPDKRTRVIIYDAAPSHRNLRWAISVVEPQGSEALVAKVVAMPENWFLLHPPK